MAICIGFSGILRHLNMYLHCTTISFFLSGPSVGVFPLTEEANMAISYPASNGTVNE